MKVLLATDGSTCSDAAVQTLCERPWPEGTEVEVLGVAHTMIPVALDPAFVTTDAHMMALHKERDRLVGVLDRVLGRIEAARPELATSAKVLEGSPKDAIIDEAVSCGADLILVGCHGYGPARRFVLGSVSHTLALHAPCSVEIVRAKHDDDVAAAG